MDPSPVTAPPEKDTSPPAPPSKTDPQSNSSPPTSSPPSDSSSSSSPPPAQSSPPPSSPPPASPPPSLPPPSETPPPKETPSSPPPTTPTSSPPPSTPTLTPTPTPTQTQSPPPNTAASPPPPTTTNPTTPTSPSIFSPPAPTTTSTPSSPPSEVTFSPPAPHGSTAHKSPPASSNSSPGSSGTTPSGSSSSSSPPSSSSSSSSTIIIGVAVAGILIFTTIIICVACSMRKKKRRPYYMDPGRPPKGNDYMYNGSQLWNNSPQSVEGHVVKLPPPPGLMGTPAGGVGGWAAPPPPPPAMTSSDYSSGYSGPHHTPLPPPSPNLNGLGINQSTFTYDELAVATGGFSQANLLGQGGFGFVHKGILSNGKEVAVKSLKSGSGQGEREFQAEVEIISRVHHRHLVSLVGYCIADGQRMLVYEFVPNKTMEFHLHGKGQPTMDWATRLRIALGSAKGLAYLHEDCHPRIIHRDIKAANILLDLNFEAMVADFGLAKLSTDNFTHVSTRVMGTFGYLAPEYASSGKLSEKSDVFSFGVMLLELITGRRPVDPTSRIMEDSLVDWARPLLTRALEDGNYEELVDPRLENNFLPHEMARMIGCASASIRHSARRRPKMSQIVRALEGDSSLEDLNDGPKPTQSSVINTNENTTGLYDTGAYNADMMKFRKMVMSNQDYASSEYGATSEYGLNPSSSSSDSREMGRHSGLQRQKL